MNRGWKWITKHGRQIDIGIGWWEGSAKIFCCGRIYYDDGYWYGFRIGPFYLSIAPYPDREQS